MLVFFFGGVNILDDDTLSEYAQQMRILNEEVLPAFIALLQSKDIHEKISTIFFLVFVREQMKAMHDQKFTELCYALFTNDMELGRDG